MTSLLDSGRATAGIDELSPAAMLAGGLSPIAALAAATAT
jgi:hypothetical protein